LASRVAVDLDQRLRGDLHDTLETMSIVEVDGLETGHVLTVATGDIGLVSRFVSRSLVFLIYATMSICAVTIVLVTLHPSLGVMVAVLLLPYLAIASSFQRQTRSLALEARIKGGDLSALATADVGGARALKALGLEAWSLRRLVAATDQLHGTNMTIQAIRARYLPLLNGYPVLILVAVLWLGSRSMASGKMTVGTLVAFIQYSANMVLPLTSAASHLSSLQLARAASIRLARYLQPSGVKTSAQGVDRLRTRTAGAIHIDNVSYTYPEAEHAALRSVSLTITPGVVTGIVGRSGSGKTTLASLLGGLFQPSEGRILIEGEAIRPRSPTSMPPPVRVLLPPAWLFQGTVHENILLGAPGASLEEAEFAARTAGAHEFICRLPDGYDTVIGKGGLTLSGGERQRLVLARSLLGDPETLVLDDPLSAVDDHTALVIEKALRKARAGRTTILMLQTSRTWDILDQLIVLNDGAVCYAGPPVPGPVAERPVGMAPRTG